MSFDPKAFAKTEWDYLRTSKTFKAVIGLETIALGGFLDGLLNGSIPLSRPTLYAFLFAQGVAVLALCLRSAFAGIEAKADGCVDPLIVKAIERGAQDALISAISAKHPEAAAFAKAVAAEAALPAAPSPGP